MRKMIVGFAALLVVAGVAYLAWGYFFGDFKQRWDSLFTQGVNAAKGYTPAKTPTEAVDGFLKAIKERDYTAAQIYLGGDYLEEFHKGTKNGQDLGLACDNLNNAMKTSGTKSDTVKAILILMDPFVTDLKVLEVKPDGDAKAYATLAEEKVGVLNVKPTSEKLDVDPRICQSLSRTAVPLRWELRKEGTGDSAVWKIFLPVTPELKLCVSYLAENGSNYVVAVNRVKEDLKNDATTKGDLERALRSALADAK